MYGKTLQDKTEVSYKNSDSEGHACLDYCPFNRCIFQSVISGLHPSLLLTDAAFCDAFQKLKVSYTESSPTTSSLLLSYISDLLTDQRYNC